MRSLRRVGLLLLRRALSTCGRSGSPWSARGDTSSAYSSLFLVLLVPYRFIYSELVELCEVAATVLLGHLHGSRAAFPLATGTCVLCIEMVLAYRACNDFTALGDAEAFGE